MAHQTATLVLSDLSVTSTPEPGAPLKRPLYVAFQLGTQVHSTSVSETGSFTEQITFVNTPASVDGQMLITVCVHDPTKAPVVVGQTVVSVKQVLSSPGQQRYHFYSFQGNNTGSVAFKTTRTGPSGGTPAGPTPTTATAGATAAGSAPPPEVAKKPGFIDQARGGLFDTLGALQRGLEDAKTKLNVGQPPQRQSQAGHTGAARSTAGGASAPAAPAPGQHYTATELPSSMLYHTKSLLADLASYTQFGLEKARSAVAPKPGAGMQVPAGSAPHV